MWQASKRGAIIKKDHVLIRDQIWLVGDKRKAEIGERAQKGKKGKIAALLFFCSPLKGERGIKPRVRRYERTRKPRKGFKRAKGQKG